MSSFILPSSPEVTSPEVTSIIIEDGIIETNYGISRGKMEKNGDEITDILPKLWELYNSTDNQEIIIFINNIRDIVNFINKREIDNEWKYELNNSLNNYQNNKLIILTIFNIQAEIASLDICIDNIIKMQDVYYDHNLKYQEMITRWRIAN